MDNLPIPQSRIEELMNAFISRDSSRISTPQSRIEEFWYHLIEGTNALPIPQSRIELLLKKIIENDTQQIPLAQSRAEEFLVSILTGDTDKLPIPQSRSEYYLDYIARNNLVLDDIEYLKYNGTNITATNTVQKPFRSAILKGQTLVNLVPRKIIDHIASSDWDGYCCLVQNSKQSFDQWRTLQDLKPNTKYYISCYVETFEDANNKDYCLNNPSVESIFEDSMIINGVGRYQWLSTTKSELTDEIFIVLRSQNAHARGAIKIRDIMIIEYQEGMKNWDIPYFEGMQSVKMPALTTSNEDGTKTNILTVNEDVTLRSNGDICDELNLLTGQLTQRIGEDGVVLSQEVVKTVDLSDNHVYSYKDVTHYDCSSAEGSLVPTLSIDVPTNLPAVVTRQRVTIQELEKENVALKNVIEETANSSVNGDLELMSSQFELDFRLFEIEMNLDMPMMAMMRGVKSMAMTVYQQAKTLILAGKYEREGMEYKLNRYKAAGRIAVEEYEELIALMDARELVD